MGWRCARSLALFLLSFPFFSSKRPFLASPCRCRPPIVSVDSAPIRLGLRSAEGSVMSDSTDPKVAVAALVETIRNIPDPLEQALAAGALMESFKEAASEVKTLRIAAVQTLSSVGWGYQRIAESLGVSKPRVQQLLNAPDVPRRPGVLEQRVRVLTAQMRAAGKATDALIAQAVVEQVRGSRGGMNWSAEQIAGWADIDESFIAAADATYQADRSS